MKIWGCKIGEVEEAELPDEASAPMRRAVMDAYTKITGKAAGFCFAGWGSELDEDERAVVEGRELESIITDRLRLDWLSEMKGSFFFNAARDVWCDMVGTERASLRGLIDEQIRVAREALDIPSGGTSGSLH